MTKIQWTNRLIFRSVEYVFSNLRGEITDRNEEVLEVHWRRSHAVREAASI